MLANENLAGLIQNFRKELVIHDRNATVLDAVLHDQVGYLGRISKCWDVTANLIKRQGHVLPSYTSQLLLRLVTNNHDRGVGVGLFQISQRAASGFGDRRVDTAAKALVWQQNDNK